jgi:nucleoside-diphosphate-sugar epimerase
MWRQAMAAHAAGRVRATEVRAADYLCPGSQSQLGDRVMRPLLAGRTVRVMRSAGTAHSWTDVHDVAALLAAVAADERAWGKPWHVPSVEPRTQRQAVDDLAAAAGVGPVKVAELAPALLRVLGVVVPLMRELPEVAYQLERDFVVDSSAAQRTFGLAPTPWATQVERQVAAYRA